MAPSLKAFRKLSFYQVLDVEEDAGAEELKKAYRIKALEHHPDKNREDKDANARFLIVQEAFETLSDSDRRADYDRSRTSKPSPWTSGTPTGSHSNYQQTPPQSHSNNYQTRYEFHYSPQTNSSSINYSRLLLLPVYILFVIVAYPLVYLWRLLSPLFSGWGLPAPIARFDPVTFGSRYPGPVGEHSTNLEQIIAFMRELNKLHPLKLDNGPMSWFTVFGNFFECIAMEERFHGSQNANPPPFGDLSSPQHSLNAFYKFWTNFETVKDFTWMSFHNVPAVHLATPMGRAQADYENYAGRLYYKAQYEGLIQAIAKRLQDTDPRRGFRGFRQGGHQQGGYQQQPTQTSHPNFAAGQGKGRNKKRGRKKRK